MRDWVLIRPVTPADAAGVYHMSSEALTSTAEELEEIRGRSPEEVEKRKDRYLHFLRHDPEGAWVASEGDRIVGVALALAREGVWILSLFAVEEGYRSAGVGLTLLERALGYAEGSKGAMLAASTHPAALRRYALAGFDLLPTLTASGTVSRGSLPAGLEVRDGTGADLQLAAEVDRLLRGAAYGPDLGFMLQTGCRLLVAESPAGRGYAVVWGAPRESSPPPPPRSRRTCCGPLSPTAPATGWRCVGSPAPRTGQSRWCLGLGSRSPPPAPSASGVSSAPSPPTCPAARSSRAIGPQPNSP